MDDLNFSGITKDTVKSSFMTKKKKKAQSEENPCPEIIRLSPLSQNRSVKVKQMTSVHGKERKFFCYTSSKLPHQPLIFIA